MQTLILAAIAFPVMIVLDLIWIAGIGNNFYRTQLGAMLRPDFLFSVAIAFYVIYAVAVAFFVLMPAIESRSLAHAAFGGALLGLAAFGAYDFTNWATLQGWPPIVSIVDLAYGTIATTITSVIGYLVATKLLHW